MFFSIENSNLIETSAAKAIVKMRAKKFILNCEFGATEERLDRYLINHYNAPLRNICYDLVQHSLFLNGAEQDITIIFRLPRDNELAELITYGNAEIRGSEILRLAFGERI